MVIKNKSAKSNHLYKIMLDASKSIGVMVSKIQ